MRACAGHAIRIQGALHEAGFNSEVGGIEVTFGTRRPLAGRRFSKPRCVAKNLGICPRTLFRWANAGKITRHKINARVVLFDEAEVVSFIEASRVA